MKAKQRNYGRAVIVDRRRPRPSSGARIQRALDFLVEQSVQLSEDLRVIEKKIDAIGAGGGGVTPAEVARLQALTAEGRRLVDRVKGINERTPPAKTRAAPKRSK